MNKAELIEKQEPIIMAAKILLEEMGYETLATVMKNLLTDLKEMEEPDMAEKYQQGFDMGRESWGETRIAMGFGEEDITVEYLDELYEKTEPAIAATSSFYLKGFEVGLDYAPEKKREEDKINNNPITCNHKYITKAQGFQVCEYCGDTI